MARTTFTVEDILITVKAYPAPSAKYRESSCTAGFTRGHEWLRIHPVPFRMLQDNQRFAKYQWIRGKVKKSTDPRPESHKIDFGSIQVLDESLPAAAGWAQRRAFLEPIARESLEDIQHEQELDNISLGFFKPRCIEELIIEPTSDQWTERELAHLMQQSFFTRNDLPQLKKVPYNFVYKYRCNNPEYKGHRQKIVDWEIYQSYRGWVRRYGPEVWEEKLRQRYEYEMQEKNDTHFFMGTMRAHPKSWIIIGLFYPPKQEALQSAFNI